jgi:hypothetical protein
MSQRSAHLGAPSLALVPSVVLDDSKWDGTRQDAQAFPMAAHFSVAGLTEGLMADDLECVARVPSTDGRGNMRKPVPAGHQGKIILKSGANMAIYAGTAH